MADLILYLSVNANGEKLRVPLQNPYSGSGNIVIRATNPDGELVSWLATLYEDDDGNEYAEYTLGSTDVTVVGTWKLQVRNDTFLEKPILLHVFQA